MGKGLNGKELGSGISQKTNGKYLARKRIGGGKRISKEFESLSEAKRYLDGSRITTVDDWFIFWIETLMGSLRINTKLGYTSRYNAWVKPVIGNMDITEVKPMNCMIVLNNMNEKMKKAGTINAVKLIMHVMFNYAVENGVISSNPVTKTVKVTNATKVDKIERFLTRAEQKAFLEEIKGLRHENQYRFILQTGLRYNELTGLKWSDIDFERRRLKVQRSGYFVEDRFEFIIGEPKTKSGYRDIYLTDEAIRILKDEKKRVKETSNYDADFIFLDHTGRPVTRNAYNKQLRRISDSLGINRLSIHRLRHTFATRCIESGMKPKTLQRILGHSDITITLNYYVHITNDEMADEMERFTKMAI